MTEQHITRRLAAIFAADVVGYSALTEADEAGTLAALRQVWSDIFNPAVAKHQGRIVKMMGDGALPTDRVLRFLDQAGLAKREARSNPTKALPGKKAQERQAAIKKAQDDAAAALAAAASQPEGAAQ